MVMVIECQYKHAYFNILFCREFSRDQPYMHRTTLNEPHFIMETRVGSSARLDSFLPEFADYLVFGALEDSK